MSLKDVPVTIVGGGPVGMSMAIALARQGIASRVLETSATTTDHPKARGVWPRAMEIFRQWGVYDAIRARGLPDESDSMTLMENLATEIDRTPPEPVNDESPARKSIVAQDAVEEALAAKLRDHPEIEMCWRTEYLEHDDGTDGVRISARDLESGETLGWTSRYLIGADGARAGVARREGIGFEGPPVLATMLNTYFRADLSRFPAARNSAGLYLRPAPGTEPVHLLNTDGFDRWLWLRRIGHETDERPRPATEEETVALIKEKLGDPSIEVELINESMWRMTRRIAERFRSGNIFLVGDAAHRFPPFGGFGMNSGIQDVHNLAWKLAYVLAGKADARLLDSYDSERRPIAHANADLSLINGARFPLLNQAIESGNRDRIRFWLKDAENHIHSIGHTLGFVYEKGAFVPDGTTPPDHTPRYYHPTDRPGSRYPHFWLDADRTRSSLDLFDRDLVLMIGPNGDAWERAAAEVSGRGGAPIQVHRLAALPEDKGLSMGPRGAVLVRPDGVTAWRIGWIDDDPVGALGAAVKGILA